MSSNDTCLDRSMHLSCAVLTDMVLCTIVQLQQLSEIDAGLRAEHMLRRHMLTERAKVGVSLQVWCMPAALFSTPRNH